MLNCEKASYGDSYIYQVIILPLGSFISLKEDNLVHGLSNDKNIIDIGTFLSPLTV